MLGATTTTSTTTTATSIMRNHLKSYQSTTIEAYTCSLCDTKFANCNEQRTHFKGDWHICNLHRKIDCQSRVTEKEFEKSLDRSSTARKAREQEWDEEYPVGSYVVLKKLPHAMPASSTSGSSDEGESVGSQDDSVDGDNQDENTESETLDALDEEANYTANGAIIWRDKNEMKLSNGKMIRTRYCPGTPRKHVLCPVSPILEPNIAAHPPSQPQSPAVAYLASTSSSFPISRHDRQLSQRDNMGIVGLSDPQRKALLAAEKKVVGLETRIKGGWEASVESKANCQKHYRIGGSRGGKKMGGLEKRLG